MSTIVNIRYGSNIKSLTYSKKPFIPINSTNPKYFDWINKLGIGLITSYIYNNMTVKIALGTQATPDNIRQKFSQIIDIFSAVAEPILWGFAIVGLVLVATGNKTIGWQRVKNVAYAYIGIQCLPGFFAFLRYIAKMLTDAFSM